MADIHLERAHALGLSEARKIARRWARQAEKEFGMQCRYDEGAGRDLVSFSRSGAQGTLVVTGTRFEVAAQLGFLLSAFKDRIEAKIVKNLDALIARAPAVQHPEAPEKSAPRKA